VDINYIIIITNDQNAVNLMDHPGSEDINCNSYYSLPIADHFPLSQTSSRPLLKRVGIDDEMQAEITD